MKFLFAEDDSKLHLIVRLWLQKNSMEMDSVFNGQEALRQLEEQDYDGLITDVNMPLMNGIELVRKVVKMDNCPSIIILLTSRCDLGQLKEEIDLSRVHLFNKPFSPAKLLELIQELSPEVRANS